MTFRTLGLAEPLLRAVTGEGYTAPTPIQAQAIPHVLAARDLLASAQTGTGKTAAFALPILQRLLHAGQPPQTHGRRCRVLVLSPTRELAGQIGDSFHTLGRHTTLRKTVIYGGVGQESQTRAIRNGVDIVIATPGRLLDLMNQGFVDLRAIEVFVLDEADRMLDMGFLPDVRRIVAGLPAQRQTLLFSATMPKAIAELAGSILRNPVSVQIAPVKATTELIQQSVIFVPRQHKHRLLAEYLSTRAVSRAIVFTRTKHGADRVARQLSRTGVSADAIHGDKSQSARQRTLAAFKADRTQVLVATDIAARGIDVAGISHVLNFDLPHEPETYVHRIGRTGRAGVAGVAVSLCDEDERTHLRAIEQLTGRKLPVERGSAEATSIGVATVDAPARTAGSGGPATGGKKGAKGGAARRSGSDARTQRNTAPPRALKDRTGRETSVGHAGETRSRSKARASHGAASGATGGADSSSRSRNRRRRGFYPKAKARAASGR
ncbi:MAG: DEAD/DEAH box helicase [Planctomycetota bacterium]